VERAHKYRNLERVVNGRIKYVSRAGGCKWEAVRVFITSNEQSDDAGKKTGSVSLMASVQGSVYERERSTLTLFEMYCKLPRLDSRRRPMHNKRIQLLRIHSIQIPVFHHTCPFVCLIPKTLISRHTNTATNPTTQTPVPAANILTCASPYAR
jgi:hypothetical protein